MMLMNGRTYWKPLERSKYIPSSSNIVQLSGVLSNWCVVHTNPLCTSGDKNHIYIIKHKVSVIYGSSMFCNSFLKATTDDGKLF